MYMLRFDTLTVICFYDSYKRAEELLTSILLYFATRLALGTVFIRQAISFHFASDLVYFLVIKLHLVFVTVMPMIECIKRSKDRLMYGHLY